MRRWRNLTVVRRRRPDPPWATTAPPSGFIGGNPRWAPIARRGEFAVTPPPAPVVVARQPRRSVTMVLARRGEFYSPPFPVVVPAGPGPLPPSMRRAPHSWSLLRRATLYAEPVWPQVAPVPPPPFVPRPNRPAGRLAARRGGEYLQVPPAVLSVPSFTRRRTPMLPVRRGEFILFNPITPAPDFRPARRPPAVPVRRGEFILFVPPTAPVAPGVPPRLTSRRRQLAGARRGRFQVLALVGAPVPPQLRDITITLGALTTGWTLGEPATGWTPGVLTTGWTMGQLEV